jgi:hypothetical protein
MKKVPFKKIKKGEYFRLKGKTLYQRVKFTGFAAQIVSGSNIGIVQWFDSTGCNKSRTPDTLVTPVNARIVED